MPHFKPNMFASGSSVFDNQSSAVWRELLGREANGTTGWFNKYGHTIGANSAATIDRSGPNGTGSIGANSPTQLMETLPNFSFAHEVTLKDNPYATAESCDRVKHERKRTLKAYLKNRNSTLGSGNRIYGWQQPEPDRGPDMSHTAWPGGRRSQSTMPLLRKAKQRTIGADKDRRQRLEATKQRLAESIQTIDSELARVASS